MDCDELVTQFGTKGHEPVKIIGKNCCSIQFYFLAFFCFFYSFCLFLGFITSMCVIWFNLIFIDIILFIGAKRTDDNDIQFCVKTNSGFELIKQTEIFSKWFHIALAFFEERLVWQQPRNVAANSDSIDTVPTDIVGCIPDKILGL